MQERTLGVATPCEKDDNHCGHSEHLRCMWRILGRTVLCYPLPLIHGQQVTSQNQLQLHLLSHH